MSNVLAKYYRDLEVTWEESQFPPMRGLLSALRGTNIYIIAKCERGLGFLSGLSPRYRAVYVGSGEAIDRVSSHSGRADILAHEREGDGLVVFACAVDAEFMLNVEKFLANDLLPLVGDRHPDVAPRSVALPDVEWIRPANVLARSYT